jgi:hypothetical protein
MGKRRRDREEQQDLARISVMHAPYNPYHAEAFGLVFKLSYALQGRNKPRVEIFLDDEEARAKEWRIYGTLLEPEDPRYAEVSFSAIGEEADFQLGASGFRMRFEALHEEIETFANGATEAMPVYSFSVMLAISSKGAT